MSQMILGRSCLCFIKEHWVVYIISFSQVLHQMEAETSTLELDKGAGFSLVEGELWWGGHGLLVSCCVAFC